MIKVNNKYIVFSVIILLFVILVGGHLPFLVFYGNIVLFSVSVLYMNIIKSQLLLKMEISDRIYYAGDDAAWKIAVAANLPVPYITLTHYENGSVLEVHRGKVTLSENMWIRSGRTYYTRGTYSIGAFGIIVYDLFGIVSLHVEKDFKKTITVYPGMYECRSFDTLGQDIFTEKRNINSQKENRYQISNIRKYCPGDSIKKIHWKVSARLNALQVRQFESTSGENIIFIVDMNRKNFTYGQHGIVEENIIDLLCSLVQYTVNRDISLKVHLNCRLPVSFDISTVTQFAGFISFIINCPSNSDHDFVPYAENIIKTADRMSKICLITAAPDRALIDMHGSLFSGHNIFHYYCTFDRSAEQPRFNLFNHDTIINKEKRIFFNSSV